MFRNIFTILTCLKISQNGLVYAWLLQIPVFYCVYHPGYACLLYSMSSFAVTSWKAKAGKQIRSLALPGDGGSVLMGSEIDDATAGSTMFVVSSLVVFGFFHKQIPHFFNYFNYTLN